MTCILLGPGSLAVYMPSPVTTPMLLPSLIERLVATFGPFLIPATLFALGAVGYLGLWLLTRYQGETYADDSM